MGKREAKSTKGRAIKEAERGVSKDGKRPQKQHWKKDPDEHDFPAAADYLSLLLQEEDAAALVSALQSAPLVHRKAKDLLRASSLPLLPPENFHVASDLAKARSGERLSPVLLVRGVLGTGVPLAIADGYHRICASYHLDEDEEIPCRIVSGGERGSLAEQGPGPTAAPA